MLEQAAGFPWARKERSFSLSPGPGRPAVLLFPANLEAAEEARQTADMVEGSSAPQSLTHSVASCVAVDDISGGGPLSMDASSSVSSSPVASR